MATKGWTSRRWTYKQLVAKMELNVSHYTVQRALKALGYQRCVACSRPFITPAQAKKRVEFALAHLAWTVNNWARVVWSDEASFMTGERGRIFITRRKGEKHCQDCIKSIYRSGRTSFMVWGAIGWGYKSKLVFLTKGTPNQRGINSRDYSEQVLKASIHSSNYLNIY